MIFIVLQHTWQSSESTSYLNFPRCLISRSFHDCNMIAFLLWSLLAWWYPTEFWQWYVIFWLAFVDNIWRKLVKEMKNIISYLETTIILNIYLPNLIGISFVGERKSSISWNICKPNFPFLCDMTDFVGCCRFGINASG